MEKSIFSPMEIDAIGEIMNISLGYGGFQHVG